MESISSMMKWEILSLDEDPITLGQLIAVALTIVVVLSLTSWLIRMVSQRLLKGGRDANLVQLISRLIWFAALTVLFFTALSMLNVPLGAFAFVTGAIAIGIGFGAQNIINNFISGWILMWERPIKIGDFLELGEARGTVESINTRSTCIRRVDGVHLLVPNSLLLENTVINWTLLDKLVRTSVRLGVAYGSDVQLVSRLLQQAAEENTDVLKDPAYGVIFDDFGDNSLIFELNVWVYATAERGLRLIRSDLRFRIDELFRENGVVIAFPQRDVHVDGQIVVQQATGA